MKLYCNNSSSLKTNNYRELIPPQFMNRHRINEKHEHVCLVYFATSNSDKLVLSKTEVSDDCRWFTKKELDDSQYDIKDNIKICAKSALEKMAS